MAEIIGTAGNDPALNGTGDADTITALGGNDTVNAGAGNDTIFGGLGNDILNGDDGDDLFIEDEFTSNLDVFNGGSGFDTIELRNISTPIVSVLGTVAFHNFTAANALTSIERLVFASTGSQIIQGGIAYGSIGSSGLVELVAGAGVDRMVYFTGTAAGTYTMPVLTYTGWTPFSLNAWEHSGDYLVLTTSAAPATAVTLNAVAGLGIHQVLSGGNGDDTLNGSDNPDTLDGLSGVNQLLGNGGNDVLVISNLAAPTGPTTWGAPSTLTGVGSVMDGGSGTDVIAIGGSVDLQAMLANIEGVLLLPEFTPPVNNTTRRYAAELILDSTRIAMLPVNTFFTGTGSVLFRPAFGSSLDTSTYSISAGSTVSFTIEAGTGSGLTFTGNSGNDTILLGTGIQTGIGGNGDDWLVVSAASIGSSVDGGAGTDTLAITGAVTLGTLAGLEAIELVGGATLTLSAAQFNTGFYNPIAQVGMASVSGTGSLILNLDPNPVTAALYLTSLSFVSGSSVTLTINGTSGLDAIKGAPGVSNTINGGDEADQIRGGSLADTIDGGGGNDKLFGWSGADVLTGGAGSDQFRYFFATDSGLGAAADRITDFQIGIDKFNFVIIDADPITPDDQAFAFIGTGAFTSPGTGQIRFQDSGADLLVQVDVDGNGTVDMEVVLQGLAGQTLTSGDFML